MAPRQWSKCAQEHFDLFLKCAEVTQSDYWKTIFQNASKGKFPPFFSYRDGKVVYKCKKKHEELELLTTDPTQLFTVMTSFFRQAGALMPDEEKSRNWSAHDDEEIPSKWTQIKSASRKLALKQMYLTEIAEKYHLTRREHDQLIHTINVGFIQQAFRNIVLENGLIKDIVGLDWDPQTRTFSFKQPKIKKQKVVVNLDDEYNCHSIETQFFLKQWKKFIDSLAKQRTSMTDSIYHRISSATLPTPIVAM